MTEAAAASAERPVVRTRGSVWSRFWNRYFPQDERSDFWWIVLPVMIMTALSGQTAQLFFAQLAQFFPTVASLQSFSRAATSNHAWTFAVFFALPWFLGVWLFRAFGRSPRELGLYALLITLVAGARMALPALASWMLGPQPGWQGDTKWFAAWVGAPLLHAVMPPIAVLLGTLAAGLGKPKDRLRATQPTDGDAHRESSWFAWLGWSGWPAEGRELFSLCFAAVAATTATVYTLASIAGRIQAQSGPATQGVTPTTWPQFVMRTVPLVIACAALLAVSYIAVVRWRGPKSIWLPMGFGALSDALVVLALPLSIRAFYQIAARDRHFDNLELASFVTVTVLALCVSLAPLFGVWLATRGGSSATLPAEGDGGAALPSSHPRSQEEANG